MLILFLPESNVAIFHDDWCSFSAPYASTVILVEFYGPVLSHALLHIAGDDLACRVDDQGIFGVLIAHSYDRSVESVEQIGLWVVLAEVFTHGEHARTITHDLTLGKG